MKASELMEHLEYLIEANGDQELTIMTQQNYPLENHFFGIANGETFGEPGKFVLLEGSNIGYGNAEAWEEAE